MGKVSREEVTQLVLESAGFALFVLCCMGVGVVGIINAASPRAPDLRN